jgi:hypothetical protein
MIEFRDKDKWCRWNGTLMSPRNCKRLFGTDCEIYVEDGWIDDGDAIYTDRPIGEILYLLGEKFEKPEPYDEILSQGYGWKDHQWEDRLGGHIMFRTDFIKNLVVKPMKQFKKDYPKFNQELHDQFYTELDNYYENLQTDRTYENKEATD